MWENPPPVYFVPQGVGGQRSYAPCGGQPQGVGGQQSYAPYGGQPQGVGGQQSYAPYGGQPQGVGGQQSYAPYGGQPQGVGGQKTYAVQPQHGSIKPSECRNYNGEDNNFKQICGGIAFLVFLVLTVFSLVIRFTVKF